MHSQTPASSSSAISTHISDLKRIVGALNFDRCLMRMVGTEQQIQLAIDEAEALFDFIMVSYGYKTDKEYFRTVTVLARQLAIYYLFHHWELAKAQKYARFYQKNHYFNTQNHALGCMLLYETFALQDDYSQAGLLCEVLRNLQTADHSENGTTFHLSLQGYANFHFGVLKYHQSIALGDVAVPEENQDEEFSDAELELLHEAQVYLIEALANQSSAMRLESPPDLQVLLFYDIARTYNLIGTIHAILGRYEQALRVFEAAREFQLKYISATHKKTQYVFTLLHNTGKAAAYCQRYDYALQLFQEALTGQREFYQQPAGENGQRAEPIHEDIAETLAHIAKFCYLQAGNYLGAIDYALQCIKMIKALGMPSSFHLQFDAQMTLLEAVLAQVQQQHYCEKEIVDTMRVIPQFDWQDHKTVKPFSEIVETLTKIFTAIHSIPNKNRELATALYQLGTYYNLVVKNPDTALLFLNDAFLISEQNAVTHYDPELWWWLKNQIALSMCLKLPATFVNADPLEQARIYDEAAQKCVEIIYGYHSENPVSENKMYAFAQLTFAQIKQQYHYVLKLQNPQMAEEMMLSAVNDCEQVLQKLALAGECGDVYLRAKIVGAEIAADYQSLLSPAQRAGLNIDLEVIYAFVTKARQDQELYEGNVWAAEALASHGRYLFQHGHANDAEKSWSAALELLENAYDLQCDAIAEFDDSEAAQRLNEEMLYISTKIAEHAAARALATGSSLSAAPNAAMYGNRPSQSLAAQALPMAIDPPVLQPSRP